MCMLTMYCWRKARIYSGHPKPEVSDQCIIKLAAGGTEIIHVEPGAYQDQQLNPALIRISVNTKYNELVN